MCSSSSICAMDPVLFRMQAATDISSEHMYVRGVHYTLARLHQQEWQRLLRMRANSLYA
jgi:hypothetical protein